MRKFLLILFIIQLNLTNLFSQPDSTIINQVFNLYDKYYNTPQNNFDSALIYLDSALKISRKHNYYEGISYVLREKGYIYSERGEFVKAMKIIIEALRLDEKINNKDGAGSDLNLIGLIYNQQEKLDEALSYFIKARDKFAEIKDEHGIAMVTGNMGMVYRNKNEFELSLKCYFNSLEYYQQEKNEQNEINIANLENNIGNIYKDIKKYDKALEYFFKAKEGKSKYKQYTSLVSTLSNIGDIYVEKKLFNEALSIYNEALAMAVEQKSIRLQKDVYFDLSYMYKEQGNFKLAYETFKESTQLKDSIISEKNNEEIANLKVRYETDKKEKENVILTKDNELKSTRIANERKQKLLFASLSLIILMVGVFIFIQFRTKQKLSKQLALINDKIKNQNTTLKTLNKELIDSEENLTLSNSTKDQLISMLSHDLYNPITSVINYTNLTLESIEQKSKEELQGALTSINGAVIPLQDLLDNILQWARVQKIHLQPNIDKIHLNIVISDIIKLYQPLATFKQIQINYNKLTEDIIKSDKLMIYFIIRNIVNNSVKFSPKENIINIEANIINNTCKILVKDYGAGFKHEILSQLNDIETNELKGQISGSGIGLSVSKKFIKLLKGNIEFRNAEKGGAEILITIPQY
ncbi:MAG: tetratricopeptide repeat protein [Bacteroidia bacterium]|nr:tetratricopeptide repeat protein [Bacteroidia bacterium]